MGDAGLGRIQQLALPSCWQCSPNLSQHKTRPSSDHSTALRTCVCTPHTDKHVEQRALLHELRWLSNLHRRTFAS